MQDKLGPNGDPVGYNEDGNPVEAYDDGGRQVPRLSAADFPGALPKFNEQLVPFIDRMREYLLWVEKISTGEIMPSLEIEGQLDDVFNRVLELEELCTEVRHWNDAAGGTALYWKENEES
jgi:hypothetical protein